MYWSPPERVRLINDHCRRTRDRLSSAHRRRTGVRYLIRNRGGKFPAFASASRPVLWEAIDGELGVGGYPASSAPMSNALPSGTWLPKKSCVPVVQPVRPAQAFVPVLMAGDPGCSVHWVAGLPTPS